MCAHDKRFKESVLDIIDQSDDSKSFKKIIIHIDEGHKYVPSFRDQVTRMNNYDIVEQIKIYSVHHLIYGKIKIHFIKIYI